MGLTQRRIEVHHRPVPPAVASAMGRKGRRGFAGAPLSERAPRCSVDGTDARGLQTAILSLSASGDFSDNVQQACDLARAWNEYAADLRIKNPGRPGWFAVLPPSLAAPGCAKAARPLDRRETDGAVLAARTQGRLLGDPAYDNLMAELSERHAVFIGRPILHAARPQLGIDVAGILLEFLRDTTRTAVDLGRFDSGTGTWSFLPPIVAPLFAGEPPMAHLQAATADCSIAMTPLTDSVRSSFRDVSEALALKAARMDQQDAKPSLLSALWESWRLSETTHEEGTDECPGVLAVQRSLYATRLGFVLVGLARLTNQVESYDAIHGGAHSAQGRHAT